MSKEPVILVNLLKAKPGKQDALIALLQQSTDTVIRTLNGWKTTRLIAADDGSGVVIYSEWETPAAVEAMRSDPRMQAGRAIYTDQCAACHTMDGTGIQRMFPQLKGSPFVQQPDPTSLLQVVVNGTRAVATDERPTGPAMPAFGWKLSDAQIAAVLTYIRNAWGNAAPPVSPGDAGSIRNAGGSGS